MSIYAANLQAEAVDSSTVKLTWDDQAGVAAWTVMRGITPGECDAETIATVQQGRPLYFDNVRTPGSTLYYWVTA